MRCVVQKVTRASVVVAGETVGEIEKGYMVLVGAEEGDAEADVNYCAEKISGLRVFEDAITFKIALMVVRYMKYMEQYDF